MEDKNRERDLKFLRAIYGIIGIIMVLVVQIVPYESPNQRLQVTLIVLAVIFGVGFNATRKLKKSIDPRKKKPTGKDDTSDKDVGD